MAINKKYVIGGIVLILIVCAVLFFTGVIHNGSYAREGTTFGPGTYVIGTDLPPGTYDFKGKYNLEGNATFKASSRGGLSISNTGVKLKQGSKVTIYEGGNMTYRGS